MWRNLELNNKVLRIIIVVMLVAVVLALLLTSLAPIMNYEKTVTLDSMIKFNVTV